MHKNIAKQELEIKNEKRGKKKTIEWVFQCSIVEEGWNTML
jgi:hypothetical protein